MARNQIKITIGELTELDIEDVPNPCIQFLIFCSASCEKSQKTKIFKYSSGLNINSTFIIPIYNINEDIIKIELINGLEPHHIFSSLLINPDQIPFGISSKVFDLVPTPYAINGGKMKISFQLKGANSDKIVLKQRKKNRNLHILPSTELSPLQRETELENPISSNQRYFDEYLHIFFFILLLYIYYHIIFHLKLFKFPGYILEFSSFYKFLDPYDPNVLVVSAYFPFPRSKYSQNEYNNWIRLFLQIINCKTIIYTTPDFYNNYYKIEIKNIPINRLFLFNFNLTFNNIYEVPCVKNMSSVFEKMNDIDREKGLHNSDLYAVWNSKVYFMREATLIYPNYPIYFWVDSGVVRDSIYERMYNKNGSICDKSDLDSMKTNCFHIGFPSQNFSDIILSRYSNPPLEICLFFVSQFQFHKYSQKKITDDVSQGIFFGTKNGIHKFYDIYWEVTNSWMKNNIFCGKEQDTFNYIFANYFDKINFYVFPAYNSYDYSHLTRIGRLKFRWFVFLSAFSRENPHNVKNNLYPSSYFLK